MWERISKVGTIKLTALTFASTAAIGELKYFDSSFKALAVQRQKQLFFGYEGDLAGFKVFDVEPAYTPITENLQMCVDNVNPFIIVDSIDLTAVSNDSLLHIGNGHSIRLQSRVMNIRQLEDSHYRKEVD